MSDQDELTVQLALLPVGGGRPLELRFPDQLVRKTPPSVLRGWVLARYSDVELTRELCRRLRDMGATAIVLSTDPLTDDKVIKVEWPEPATVDE